MEGFHASVKIEYKTIDADGNKDASLNDFKRDLNSSYTSWIGMQGSFFLSYMSLPRSRTYDNALSPQ